MDKVQLNTVDFIPIIKTKGIDHVFSMVGDFNKYQFKLMFCLGIQWLITSFVLMIQPFLTQVPTFLCKDPNNESITYICTEEEACQQGSMILADNSPNNIVTEFSLYCEQSGLRDLTGTIFFIGGSIGTLLFSHAADQYGRKRALLISYILGSFSMLLLGLASYGILPFYLFLGSSWAGYDAYFAFSFIILSEAGGTKLRGVSNSFLLIVWGFGLCIFVGLAYFIQDWRTEVTYFIGIPAYLCILLFTQIYESPRFLYTKGRYSECQDVLVKIARDNKKSIYENSLAPEDTAGAEDDVKHEESPTARSQNQTTTYMTIFQNAWLRKRFLLFTALIVYLYLSYNGILFALADVGGDIYENSIIVSFAELSAYIVSFFMVNKIKRKVSFLVIMLSAAISALFFVAIPYISCSEHMICAPSTLEGVLSLAIKFAISLSFGLIFVYGSEIFPTVARSKCVGLAASLGRGASMVTPWLDHALIIWGIKPMLFYGSLGFVMLLLLSHLPETFGMPLLDNILEEGQPQELNQENLSPGVKVQNIEMRGFDGEYSPSK